MAAYSATGGSSFDMEVLFKRALSPRLQRAIGAALIIAAATRLPLFPLHGWVKDVYSEAPLGVSVVIAGSASRLGGYLLLRTFVGADPDAARLLSPVIVAMAALTIGYGAGGAARSAGLRGAGADSAMGPGPIILFCLAALSPL